MPDQSTAQEMPVFSLEQHMMYENTISGRDSTELAYLQLRRAIVRCDIPSGVQLSQRELSQLTGVGRTPLREALRMLQREGLVEAEPNHRVRVADFSIPDLEQLYAMRISLEALAIRLTVPLLQADELRRLEGFLTQMAGLPTVRIAVNISARQFDDPRGFAEEVTRLLNATGLDPRYLELEMTESMLLKNVDTSAPGQMGHRCSDTTADQMWTGRFS